MVALNFNAAGVKPNAGFEPVPSGIYDVIITASEEKPTKSSTPQNPKSYLQLTMTIQGGEHHGKTVIERLNLKNDNQQAVDIAYGTLSAICHVTGRMQVQDSSQLHGVPFKIMVNKVERNDQPGSFSNEIKGYKDINGNDPGFAGQVQGGGQPNWAQNGGGAPQQQPVQQPVQQQQPQGGGAPNWADPQNQPNQNQPQVQQPQNGGAPAGNAPPAWAQQPAA